ncbi:MAG: AAA family ATPase [Patescibacteria group bacterium]|nr:AAA family ATPase [Patescibacteria group bacterium]
MEKLQTITIKEFKDIINTLLKSINLIQPSKDDLKKARTKDTKNRKYNSKLIEELGGQEVFDNLSNNEKAKFNKTLRKPRFEEATHYKYHNIRMDRIRSLQSFFLHGASGIGKSQAVAQVAEDNNFAFIDVRLPTIDPVDLRGIPVPNKEKGVAEWLPAGFLPQSTPAGSLGGIILLDELNSSPPSVQAAAYQLTLDKKVGEYKVPDGWLIFAAGNRAIDRGVTYNIPKPLANRFTHFEIVHDVPQWLTWARDNRLDPFVISFISLGFSRQGTKITQSYLHNFDAESPSLAYATPRSWEFVSNLQPLRDVNIKAYFAAVRGTVGKEAGGMFETFVMHKNDLPNPKDVLEGKPFDMPEEIDSQFVMISMLIETINQHFSLDYVNNFVKSFLAQFESTPRADIAILGAKELLARFSTGSKEDRIIDNSPEFLQFCMRNAKAIRGFEY